MNRKRQEEFYCGAVGGGCGRYFLTWLSDSMWGNYTIECPACKHHHYRIVVDGLVTDDRHQDRYGKNPTILVPMSDTLHDRPLTTEELARLNMRLVTKEELFSKGMENERRA